MDRTFDKRLLTGVGLLVAVMFVNAGLAYRNIRLLYDTNQQVMHTYEVLAAIQQILSAARDAETGQRGFLITGNPSYLAPFHAAEEAIEGDLKRAGELTQDHPQQQAHCADLSEHVHAKLDELQATIDLRRNEGFEAAKRVVETHAGKKHMDAMRAITAAMADEENALLAKRAADARESRNLAVTTPLASAVVGLLLILVFVMQLRRHLLERIAAAHALNSQKELYRTTLTSIGDAVITTDASGRVTMLNEIAELLTGSSPSKQLGWRCPKYSGSPTRKLGNLLKTRLCGPWLRG